MTASGRDPDGVLPELDRLIDAWCADYRVGCGAYWIPVARQVEYQARVVLAAFDLAGRPTRPHAPADRPARHATPRPEPVRRD